MANKKIWLGILVMVLVLGMAVVGCDDGNGNNSNGNNGGGNDTWSKITDQNQLNGTWKALSSQTLTIKEYYEEQIGSMDQETQTLAGNISVKLTTDDTWIINVNTKTIAIAGVATVAFSGGNINQADVWNTIKESFGSDVQFNESNKSANWTYSFSLVFTDEEMAEILQYLQINQNGKKLKIPAAVMDATGASILSGVDVIATK